MNEDPPFPPEILEKLRALFADPRFELFQKQCREEAKVIEEWRFGKTGGLERIVEIAEELERVRRIDLGKLEVPKSSNMARIRSAQKRELSQWLTRIKRAVDEGDSLFFEDIAQALRMLTEKPSVTRDARFFALLVVREFREAGIEPGKADVREEVERRLAEADSLLKSSPNWQRDVWPSHPELASLQERAKGAMPRRLNYDE